MTRATEKVLLTAIAEKQCQFLALTAEKKARNRSVKCG